MQSPSDPCTMESLDSPDFRDSQPPTAINSMDDSYIDLQHTRDGLPAGWSMYIHPRGWVYFRNDEYNVVVDEDIRVPDKLSRIMAVCAASDYSTLPDGVEICLLSVIDSAFSLTIDHHQCTGRYSDAKDRSGKTMSMPGLLRSRRLYWNFVQQHPSHISTPQRAFKEAVDAIKAFYWDNLIHGARSDVPFSKTECEELLRIMDSPHSIDQDMQSTTTLIAWILREVYSFKRAERFGQLTYSQLMGFRESIARAPYIPPPPSNIAQYLLKILVNGPFFGIPLTYLEHIRRASEFRGRLSSLSQNWENYTQQLTREYSDFILVSTVLLSATVGMLSVANLYQAARVCSILSALTALGSATIGVFFIWRHQSNSTVSSSHTYAYIYNARNNILGLPGHALLLSLPAVLLVWSLIAFTVAMMAYALQTITNGQATDSASTWLIIGVFLLVVWCMIAAVYAFSVMWKFHSGIRLVDFIKHLFHQHVRYSESTFSRR